MATAWFLMPYKIRLHRGQNARSLACNVDGLSELLNADQGHLKEVQCLGNHTVCKVRASQVTLDAFRDAGYLRIDKSLNASLADLSVSQRNAIRSKLNALGYSLTELDAELTSDLRNKTLREVLAFAVKRYHPNFDPVSLADAGVPVLQNETALLLADLEVGEG